MEAVLGRIEERSLVAREDTPASQLLNVISQCSKVGRLWVAAGGRYH